MPFQSAIDKIIFNPCPYSYRPPIRRYGDNIYIIFKNDGRKEESIHISGIRPVKLLSNKKTIAYKAYMTKRESEILSEDEWQRTDIVTYSSANYLTNIELFIDYNMATIPIILQLAQHVFVTKTHIIIDNFFEIPLSLAAFKALQNPIKELKSNLNKPLEKYMRLDEIIITTDSYTISNCTTTL